MPSTTASQEVSTSPDALPAGWRMRNRVLIGVANLVLVAAALFWLAGRLDWTRGWAFLGLFVAGQTISALVLGRRDPELLRRRMRIGAGTKRWDRWWLALFMVLFLSILTVAALDSGRFGWSSAPSWTWCAGAVLYALSLALTTWTMTVNTHFEKTVRIQRERGHRVIDRGPYAFVRHPGYLFIIAGIIPSPALLLGSWWALLPASATAAWLVLRTALEDRTLRRELPGYEEYARRVRYRLIPALW